MFTVNVFDLSADQSAYDSAVSATAGRPELSEALESAMTIAKYYTNQGWIKFEYSNRAVHGFVLVKPDEALFKLIEVA